LATGNKTEKNKLVILAVIVAILVILLSVFWIIPQILPAGPIQSVSNYYLPGSKIFVVSANASYGRYPGETRSYSGVENGEPCVIINVTVRNDYSAQYPPPNPASNSTRVFVSLTAQIFCGKNQISASDLSFVGLEQPDFDLLLNSGESGNLPIYLGTTNKDVTSFKIVAFYIGGEPRP